MGHREVEPKHGTEAGNEGRAYDTFYILVMEGDWRGFSLSEEGKRRPRDVISFLPLDRGGGRRTLALGVTALLTQLRRLRCLEVGEDPRWAERPGTGPASEKFQGDVESSCQGHLGQN
jgi:hypothetical protein